MGIFDFLKDSGKDVDEGKIAEAAEHSIRTALGDQFENLSVSFEDGTVTLSGTAASQEAKEKAVLLAGNVRGVDRVNDDQVQVKEPATKPEQEAVFYTIEKGDSLSQIAEAHYGDADRWRALFEANREIIEDPDLIYPGQRIRIPANPV